MYHKIAMPAGAVAAGGGALSQSVWMIVAGATLLIAGLAVISLAPKFRAR